MAKGKKQINQIDPTKTIKKPRTVNKEKYKKKTTTADDTKISEDTKIIKKVKEPIKKITREQKGGIKPSKRVPIEFPINDENIKKYCSESNRFLLSIDPGTVNLSYCLLSIDKSKVIRWNTISLASGIKETNEKICLNLLRQLLELDLTNIPELSSSNHKPEIIILIEVQPKVNTRTSIIAGQLLMFYNLEKNGFLPTSMGKDPNKTNSKCYIQKIIGYSPKYKLKYYEPHSSDEPIYVNHIKDAYRRRKETSIQHTDRLIKRDQPELYQFYANNKKQDDYGDSYLQGKSYIHFEINKNKTKKILDDIQDINENIKKEIEEDLEEDLEEELEEDLEEDLKKDLDDLDKDLENLY